jgi:hypothetical protein
MNTSSKLQGLKPPSILFNAVAWRYRCSHDHKRYIQFEGAGARTPFAFSIVPFGYVPPVSIHWTMGVRPDCEALHMQHVRPDMTSKVDNSIISALSYKTAEDDGSTRALCDLRMREGGLRTRRNLDVLGILFIMGSDDSLTRCDRISTIIDQANHTSLHHQADRLQVHTAQAAKSNLDAQRRAAKACTVTARPKALYASRKSRL